MTTVEPGTKCGWCGGEIYPFAGQKGYVFSDASAGMEEGWFHADWRRCLSTALTRAQTAEHQLGEVREGLADARKTAAAERERVLALEQRVAELEGGEDAVATETFTEYLDAACRGSLSAYYEVQTLYRTTLARVVKLEKAARPWRPMGGPPPASEQIEIRRVACVYPPSHSDEGTFWTVGSPEGWFICWWSAGNGWEWRPLSQEPDKE